MTKEEKYYRRSYNAFEKLNQEYNHGYDIDTLERYIKNQKEYDLKNRTTSFQEQLDLIISIFISLIGFNKEAIEKSGHEFDFFDYKPDQSILENINDYNCLKELKELCNQRMPGTNSAFDDWLFVIENNVKKNTEDDYMRCIRNSLLHSDFSLSTDKSLNTITMEKYYGDNKVFSFEVLPAPFMQFAYKYYSNLPLASVTDKLFEIFISNKNISNSNDLKYCLENTVFYKYSVNTKQSYDGTVPLGAQVDGALKNLKNKKGLTKKKVEKFIFELNSLGINLNNFDKRRLDSEGIDLLMGYIENKYGNEFYLLSDEEKKNRVIGLLEYYFDPRFSISNWLNHFWMAIAQIQQLEVKTSFAKFDEYCVDSLEPSLLVLKGYIVLYRLQNKTFSQIEYDDIDIDINDLTIKYKNVDGTSVTNNYFNDKIIKHMKKEQLDYDLAQKAAVCEIIRNSLAHGNIDSKLSFNNDFGYGHEMIFIDRYKGKEVSIICPSSTFKQYLDSPFFNPRNCKIKENEKVLVRSFK